MSNITKNTIGKRVKSLREQSGKSQEELSELLGFSSRSSLSQIETGERDLTSVELSKLTAIFGVPADYILSGKEITQEVEIETPREELEERIAIPKLKKSKFKEVLLYLLEQVAGKPNIGETVLYKLLYFSDFNYYEKF